MEMNYQDQPQTVEVAGFIAKTFQILNNQQYSRIIYWSPTGCQFIIKDINKFQQVVLPKYFRHNKINSFIRQLNMYGFHKSRKQHSKSVFSHPLFQKNRDDLLPEIKRKIKQNQSQEPEKFETPVKPQKILKEDIETAVTGRQMTEQKQRHMPMPSLKQFNFLENYGSSFRQLFESKEVFSRQNLNLNFSLNKISQNCIGEVQKGGFKQIEQDVISIEQGIQEKQERQKEFLNLPSIAKFQNPSCFFNSFILKE